MSWDTTVSNLNPYVWIKMDAAGLNHGSHGNPLEQPFNTNNYSGNPIVFNTTGGRTGGAYITEPSTGNNSAVFYAVDQGLTYPALAPIQNKSVSLMVWFRTTNVTTGTMWPLTLTSGGTNDSGAVSFIIPGTNDVNNSGKLVFNANTGSGTGQTYTGGGIPGPLGASIDGNWHLAGVVINGNTIYWYYDGQNVGQSNFTGSKFYPMQYWFGFGGNFNGDIDDFVLFNYPLTQNQMADLYNSTIPSAPLKYFDGTNWVTPQDALLWNGQNFNSTFGHQVWNGSNWINITP
jgi:hypothetical protein